MKKTISICLFTVILAFGILGSIFIWNDIETTPMRECEIAEYAENSESSEEILESMYVHIPLENEKEENAFAYQYFLKEDSGILLVYEADGETLLLEMNVSLYGVDEATKKLLQEGIWLTDEKELYDFLESYSS